MSSPFDTRRALIVIDARLTGPAATVTVRLALDTGATWSIVAARPLRTIGYDPALSTDRTTMITGSRAEVVPWITVARIAELGENRTNFRVLGHTVPQAIGVDGVLGLDFVRGRRLTIAFRVGSITLE
jgi:hypothetical protein